MLFCRVCNSELPEDSKFCINCGAKLGADSIEEPSHQSGEQTVHNIALEQETEAAEQEEARKQEAAALSKVPDEIIEVRKIVPIPEKTPGDFINKSLEARNGSVRKRKKTGTLIFALFLTVIIFTLLSTSVVYYLFMSRELVSFDQEVSRYEEKISRYDLGTKKDFYFDLLSRCQELTPAGKILNPDIFRIREVNYIRIQMLKEEMKEAEEAAAELDSGLQVLKGQRDEYEAVLNGGNTAPKDYETGEALLEELGAAIADADMEKGQECILSLEQLTQSVAKKREEIEQYSIKYQEINIGTEEYIMSLLDQNIYEGRMEQYQTALEAMDVEGCNKAFEEMTKLKQQIETNSKNTVAALMQEVKKLDLKKALEAEIALMKEYSQEVNALLADHKYVSASKKLNQWKLLSESVSGKGKYSLKVGQADMSEYPKVKLYLRFQENASGKSVDTEGNIPFSLWEKTDDTSGYKEKSITKVTKAAESEPVNIYLAADVSKTMDGSPLFVAKTLMNDFLSQAAKEDKISVAAFAELAGKATGFTSDRELLSSAVNGMLAEGESGALYDALYLALGQTAGQKGMKCIIAFTDSRANTKNCTPEIIEELAGRYQIPIYIIGVGDKPDGKRLSMLCEASGGYYRNIKDIIDMGELYTSIYEQQKEWYVLEYETELSAEEVQLREVYLNYIGDEMAARSEYLFVPSKFMEWNTSYSKLYYKDFIIFDSDKRYVTAADLEQLMPKERKLAVSEIYARKGQHFSDREIQDYFEERTWYKNTEKKDKIKSAQLNSYERANIFFITTYERFQEQDTEE